MRRVVFFSLTFLAGTGHSFGQLSATVDGDTARIWDANFEFGCGASFFPDYRIVRDTLYLAECDTAFHLPCRCVFTLCTSISGFAPGTYTAVVTREMRRYFHDPDSIYSYVTPVGSVTFTILENVLPSCSLYQSPCGGIVGIESDGPTALPSKLEVRAYPNPFNPTTMIRYGIPNRSHVTLTVFNTWGQEVATLVRGEMEAGYHEVPFDATRLAGGAYLCQIRAGEFVETRTLILVK